MITYYNPYVDVDSDIWKTTGSTITNYSPIYSNPYVTSAATETNYLGYLSNDYGYTISPNTPAFKGISEDWLTVMDREVLTSGYYTGGLGQESVVKYTYVDLDSWGNWGIPVSKKDQFQQKIRSNLVIQIKSRVDLDSKVVSPAELRAMETLREIISESDFRKYLRYGFVLIKGQSGSVYQIFKNRSHTKVWRDGKIVEEICVRIKDQSIPPTDNIMAFKTIIETNEEEFKKLGNVYKMAA